MVPMALHALVDEYLRGVALAVDQLSRPDVVRAIDLLLAARDDGRRVYLFGNGGSAATASHMANDLNKQCAVDGVPRFRAIALNDNVPTMMAWANDQDYGDILAEQLANHLESGDLVVLISTSGNSPNVVRGAEFARRQGATVIGFTGPNGGLLAQHTHVCVRVPSADIGQQEDVHLVLNHTIGAAIRAFSMAAA
jgi:D-sedoheptulose 7-phosphate isomerase